MKSIPGKNYRTPSKIYAKELLEEKGLKVEIAENAIHIANYLSGGDVRDFELDESHIAIMLAEFDPEELMLSKDHSYLNYAIFMLLKYEELAQQTGDKKEIAKQIKEEVEMLNNCVSSGDSKEELTELLRISGETFSNITWLVSRVMDSFIPENSKSIENLVECAEGGERIYRVMNDIEELSKINAENHALPELVYFNKIANQEFDVAARAEGTIKNQFIYVMVDTSGSMRDSCNKIPYLKYRRIDLAYEICMKLLERTINGSSRVVINTFNDALYNKYNIDSYDKNSYDICNPLLCKALDPNGGTNVQRSLIEAMNDISKKYSNLKNEARPEILIITDGTGSVDKDAVSLSYKLNYINVEKERAESLYELCDNFIEF